MCMIPTILWSPARAEISEPAPARPTQLSTRPVDLVIFIDPADQQFLKLLNCCELRLTIRPVLSIIGTFT